MTQSSQLLRGQMLAILADNQFHSGQALGQKLGTSRATISNHIKTLTSLGLDIYKVTGKGYRLAQPLNLLNKDSLQSRIQSEYSAQVEVLNVIDSTNQYLKNKLPTLNNGHCCLAEAQTAGRGRHGRKWVSPYAASLYLSMYWGFTGGHSVLGGLSLAIGVGIVNALDACGLEGVQLKWPNDIYAQGKKLAGVLIEVEGQMGGECQTVVGIGLNIALPENIEDIGQPWIDLSSLSSSPVDRNEIASILITEMHKTLMTFEETGLKGFISQWRNLDVYANQTIHLIMGQKTITGISRGIDHNGALLLENELGIRAYHGGEISVRPA